MTTFLYVFVPKKDDIYMNKELKKRKECSNYYCIFPQQQKWLVIIWWWPPRTACIVFFDNVSRWLRPGTFFDILHAHVLRRLLQQHGVLLLRVRRPQSSPQRTLLHKKRGLKTFRLAKSADVVWLQACRANLRLFCSVCGVALLLLKLHAY